MYEMLVPELISIIPDIREIYAINDTQSEELDHALLELENNIFLTTMNESKVKRWEAILNITPLDYESLEDRRFRIRSRVMERLPYSFRIIRKKLQTLSPEGISVVVESEKENVIVRVALESKTMMNDVSYMLDMMLPLNMTFSVILMYNSWELYRGQTWASLSDTSWKIMREEVVT
jgi:hypothetical protein